MPYRLAPEGPCSHGSRTDAGAVIGGSGHRVAEGNHHDERMMRLAESMPGVREYFPWGHQ